METNEILSKILDKLDILTKNTNTEINSGTYQYSTKDYNINLLAGESRTLYTPFRSFIVLSNPDYQNVDFYIGYATEPTIQQAGQGVEMPEAVPFLKIVNRGMVATSVLINLGFGKLLDNRTNISNTVDTNVLSIVPLEPKPYVYDSSTVRTFSSLGDILLSPVANQARLLIQNSGSLSFFVGGFNGVEIMPYGSFEIDTNKALSLYGTSGQTVRVTRFRYD